jgi:hypothetical protein
VAQVKKNLSSREVAFKIGHKYGKCPDRKKKRSRLFFTPKKKSKNGFILEKNSAFISLTPFLSSW